MTDRHRPWPARIAGIGMASSLGSAVHGCAAARAGVSRLVPVDLAVEDPESGLEVPLQGHAVRGLTEGYAGIGRLWRLAEAACADFLRHGRWRAEDAAKAWLRLHARGPYYEHVVHADDRTVTPDELAGQVPPELGESRAIFESKVRDVLLQRVGERLGVPPDQRDLSFGGPAGFIEALAHARELAAERRLQQCIVVCVDSNCDPALLNVLAELDLLKTPANPVGFAPGESGVVLWLEDWDERRGQDGGAPEPLLTATAFARGDSHRFADDVASGELLSSCIRDALAGAPKPRVLIGDFNGDGYRAAKLGDAMVRLRPIVDGADLRLPAANFGDAGAAASALSICTAVQALARGYGDGGSILVFSDGDDGSVAACSISAGASRGKEE